MARCPKCKQVVGITDAVCEHCGHALGTYSKASLSNSWPDLLLLLGTLVAALFCVAIVVVMGIALWQHQWLVWLWQQQWLVWYVFCPAALVHELAFLVLLVRTQKAENRVRGVVGTGGRE